MSAEPPIDRDRLQVVLAGIVAHHAPTADGWTAIQARLAAGPATGELPVPAPIGGSAPGERRRPRRRLALAAVVVVLAGIAGAVALARPAQRPSTLQAGPGAPTGWYLPTDLPAGWTVDLVRAWRSDNACPCREASWANGDRTTVITLRRVRVPAGTTSPPADQLGEQPTPVDLGPVQGARVAPMGDGWFLEWYDGDAWSSVEATGLDRSEAQAIGRALVADPDRTASPVPGLVTVDDIRETGRTSRRVLVSVSLTTPSGHHAGYRLSTPYRSGPLRPFEVVHVPGQPLPLTREESGRAPAGSTSSDELAGAWPGADIVGQPFFPTNVTPNATEAEVEALLASLRPATPSEWQAFVADASDHDPRLDDASTLESLLDLPADPPGS